MLQTLTSLQNPKVKLARSLANRKARVESGLFLAEGTKLLAEAIAWGFEPAMTFATAEWWASNGDRPEFLALTGERYEVSTAVLEAVATTKTPDPVVALLPLPADKAVHLKSAPLVVIAHKLQDPGNLGTIIRSADAAGADAVVVTENTVDPYSPKVVRATMGSLFHLPILRMPLAQWAERHAGIPLYALTLGAKASLYAQDYRAGAAFLIGNEGEGLSAADAQLANHALFIPMPGHAESLNAAMAATICLFEAARQRVAVK